MPPDVDPRSLHVPDRLNAVLVAFVSLGLATLLIVAARIDDRRGLLLCVMLFALLFQTNFALLHEAGHDKLHSTQRWQGRLAFLCGLWFGMSPIMFAVTHRNHHLRNRTDAEMFDLYRRGESPLRKRIAWYGMLIGLWYWTIYPANVLLLLAPRTYRRLAERWQMTDTIFLELPSTARRIRTELAVIVLFPIALIALGVPPLRLLACYATASFLWSTTQYLEHAYAPRLVIDGAFNLRAPRLYGWLNLHRELDLNHHRHPGLSWLHLPKLSMPDEARRSYLASYLRQWRGPIPADEPEPLSREPA